MTAQLDKNGYFNSIKIFPCECGTEGVTVVIEEDKDYFDCEGAPFIGMGFWEFRSKLESRAGLPKWERIKYAYRILKGRSPWVDMVWMRSSTARNLANHILYLMNKARKSENLTKPLVDWPSNIIVGSKNPSKKSGN